MHVGSRILVRVSRPPLPIPLAVLAASLMACGAGRSATATMTDDAKRERIETMYAEYRRQSFPDVPEVSAAELPALAARGEVVVVDVRTAAEQAVSMIPGAMTREAFEAKGADLAGKRVVTYCTIGYRSGLYASELRARGIDAANLAGSVLAWSHQGLPFTHDGADTKRVHVYGKTWNLAASGYEAVW